MADIQSSVNTEALRQAQSNLDNEASESYTQYSNANQSVQNRAGNAGDGSIGGKLGEFVSNQWSEDTAQAVKNYQEEAQHLLQEALSTISKNAGNLSSETQSIYKNN